VLNKGFLRPGQLGRNLQKVSPPHPLFLTFLASFRANFDGAPGVRSSVVRRQGVLAKKAIRLRAESRRAR